MQGEELTATMNHKNCTSCINLVISNGGHWVLFHCAVLQALQHLHSLSSPALNCTCRMLEPSNCHLTHDKLAPWSYYRHMCPSLISTVRFLRQLTHPNVCLTSETWLCYGAVKPLFVQKCFQPGALFCFLLQVVQTESSLDFMYSTNKQHSLGGASAG
jgi:hypothetical protein